MEIKKPPMEKKEVEVRETFLDEKGNIQVRIKKVLVPTGKLIENNKNLDNHCKMENDR